MRTRSRKATSNQAPSSGRRSSLRVARRGIAAAEGQQLGAQVDHELHALRHADELAQQPHGGRLERLHQRARRLLGGPPALDLGQRRLARQPVVVRQGQQEFLAAGRREREIRLTELRRAAAPRRLAALAFEAGVDAVLEPRDVVVGKIGTQRRADDLARAACGFDEGVAQPLERAARRCWRREGPCRGLCHGERVTPVASISSAADGFSARCRARPCAPSTR